MPPRSLPDRAAALARIPLTRAGAPSSRAALLVVACAACGGTQGRMAALEARVHTLEAQQKSRPHEADDLNTRVRKLEQMLADLHEALLGERQEWPDSDRVFAVPIDGAPFVGPRDAKVTIVKGFEFACGYCAKVRPTLAALRDLYPDQLKIVFKHYIVHPIARDAALASCAADHQELFVRFSDLLWERLWGKDRSPVALERKSLLALARKAGLDVKRMKTDMDSQTCADRVERDQAELIRVGARGTPAFFINGRYLPGAQPLEVFREIIDEELRKADASLENGAKLEDYYREAVLERGEASFR